MNIETNKKYYHALNLLKTIAIILIFNSHCDVLYPEKIRFLATGGAVGNCLFFILAGYFLNTNGNFLEFLVHKIKRLYPITIISAVVYIFIKPDIPNTVSSFVTTFLWPTYLWFIGALLIFYIASYFLFNHNVTEKFGLFTLVIFACYFIYYLLLVDKTYWSVETKGILSTAGIFKLIYYFFLFCYGSFVKRKNIRFKLPQNISLLAAVILFMLSLFTKLLLQKGLMPMSFQFVAQLMGMLVAIFGLDYALKTEENYTERFKRFIIIPDFLGKYALSINLAQLVVIDKMQGIIFPINVLIAFAVTIIYSIILEKITNMIALPSSKKSNS